MRTPVSVKSKTRIGRGAGIYIILSTLCLLLCGCSSSDSFKIKGEISGNPDMNISLSYYANDTFNQMVTVARKGEFEVECQSKNETVVEISDGNGRVLGLLYASPGDKITCRLDRNNPFRIQASGNALTERWCEVVNPLADKLSNGSAGEINLLVEEFITDHPTDPVASMLFARCYDASANPHKADSLMRAIAPEGQNAALLDSYITLSHIFADSAAVAPIKEMVLRTTTDTAYRFSPSEKPLNFIAITADRYDWRHDSVRGALRRIYALPKVQVLSLSVASDTFIWKRIVRQDSVKCLQAWAPGGELAPQISRLAVPTLPFFIVADSTGQQLLRTPSLTVAENFITEQK